MKMVLNNTITYIDPELTPGWFASNKVAHQVIMISRMKLDDSAFFWTKSYITEDCYFEYLQSLLIRKLNQFLTSS